MGDATKTRPEQTTSRPPASGCLGVFLGPMFSGKTTELARVLRRARLAGLPGVLVKHADDDRYDETHARGREAITTHDGIVHRAAPATPELGELRIVRATRLADVELRAWELDVGIDEGQFFPDLREALAGWMREGRRIHVAALDGDFRRRMFSPVVRALPLATQITKLSAICMLCPRSAATRPAEAHYTVRISPETAVRVVGAKDKYRAACLPCYERASAAARAATSTQ